MTNAPLNAEIQQKRAELAQVQAEIADLQQELNEFAWEYDRVVGSAEAQLDIVRQQIEAIQNAHRFENDSPQHSTAQDTFGDGYESVEAQFRRAMDPNAAPRRAAISLQPEKD